MSKKEYLQLPPFEVGEDSNVVKMIWEYLNSSEDAKNAVMAEINLFNKGKQFSKPEHDAVIRKVPKEELADYHEAIRETIRQCIRQACSLTYLVMKECFFKGRPVDDLVAELPMAEIMIRAIYELFLQDEDTFFEDLEKIEKEKEMEKSPSDGYLPS